jgi:hypothetical protein
MAKRAQRVVRREWTAQDEKELRKHAKGRTPVKAISKALKRTPGALRQKRAILGLGLGIASERSSRMEREEINSSQEEPPTASMSAAARRLKGGLTIVLLDKQAAK